MKMNVKIDLEGLENVRKSFGERYEARVGVLGSTATRDNEDGGDLNNAEIGAIHEFGVITKNIPARSFLRMPIESKSKQIAADVAKKRQFIEQAAAEGDIELIYEILGVAAEKQVLKAFMSGGFGKWQPNAPETLRNKDGNKPLINTRQLRDAITSEVKKRD